MKEYMILEAKPLTQAEISKAISRAHQMRSEACWMAFIKVGDWLRKITHSKMSGGSGLAHSS